MMSCIESYKKITEALKDNPEKEMKDALWVLEQFKKLFENVDKAVCDSVMIDICRNLPELHFKSEAPITDKPVKIILDEYFKRTGILLPGFFCIKAYYSTFRRDLAEKTLTEVVNKKNSKHIIDAEREQLKRFCCKGEN